MTGIPVTDLNPISKVDIDPANDILNIVDVSDSTMGTRGSNKRVTVDDLVKSVTDTIPPTWGDIVGDIEDQVDLFGLLSALSTGKVSKSGDTMTGALLSNLGTLTANTPGINLTQTWNNSGTTFDLFSGTITATAASNQSRWFNFSSTNNWGSGSNPYLRANIVYGTLEISSVWGQGGIALGLTGTGGTIDAVYGTGFIIKQQNNNCLILNTGYGDSGIEAQNTGMPIGWTDVKMRRDGADTLALYRTTNAQRFNLYGTRTDGSNYRRFYISSTTSGAFTLGVEGLGTGANGNTLNIANDVTSNSAYITNSNLGWKFLAAPAYNPTQTTGLYHGGNGYHYWYSEGSIIMRWHPSGITEIPAIGVTGVGTFGGLVKGSRFQAGIYDDNSSGFNTYQTSGHFFAGGNVTYAGTPVWNFRAGPGYVMLGDSGNGITLKNGGQNSYYGNLTLATGTATDPGSSACIFGFRFSEAYLSVPLALGRQGTSSAASTTHEGAWLHGEASDTLAIRRSTNAQRFNLYGTHTDNSNYRRFYISSTTGGSFTLGVEGLGTGASGNTLSFAHSIFTVDGAGFISGGGNGGLGLGGGFYVRSAGSDVARFYAGDGSGRLLSTSDFRYQASAHRFRNTADSADAPVYASAGIFSGGLSVQGGNISLTSSSPGAARLEMTAQQYTPSNIAINIPWGTGSTHGIYGSNGLVGFASSGTAYFEVNTAGLVVANNRYVALGGTIASPQTLLFSGGSNVLEQRNGTNPQVLRIYNAFIDSSNYDRGFIRWNSNVFEIGTEILGSYTTARAMVFASGGSCSIQTNGATRFSVGTNGQVVIAGAFSGASGANSIALVGDFLNVTGQNAVGHGGIPGVGGATVAATNSFGICGGGTVSGADGSLSHGFTAIARVYSSRAFASHRFSTNGDVQGIEAILRNKTTDATPVILNANSASNRLTVPSGKIMHLVVNVTGVKSDGSAVAVYLRQVVIKNVAGTTSIVGAVNTIGVDQTSGTNLNITADDSNDALQIEVTGIVGETWRWEAIVYGSDLTYGT